MVKAVYEWNVDDEMADEVLRNYFGDQQITFDNPDFQKFMLRLPSVATLKVTKVKWSGSSWQQRKVIKSLINEELIPQMFETMQEYFTEDEDEEVEEAEDCEDWVSKH